MGGAELPRASEAKSLAPHSDTVTNSPRTVHTPTTSGGERGTRVMLRTPRISLHLSERYTEGFAVQRKRQDLTNRLVAAAQPHRRRA